MSQTRETPLAEFGLLILLSFLWGGSFTLIKIAVETVPPATLVTARLAIAALLLLALVRAYRIKFPKTSAAWRAFLVQGILQSALPFTLISWGEQHIDSGLAGLLNSTPPLFALLITICVLRERHDAMRKFIGAAIGFAGVLVTLGTDVLAGTNEAVMGQLAVIAASVCYAVAPVYARRFKAQPALLTAACSMTMATLIMAPIAFYTDDPMALSPSHAAIWSIMAMGVFSTALAMVIYFRLVRTLGTMGVTSGSYLRAGFSVLLGFLVLNEEPSWSLAAGLVLIFLGVAVVTGQIRFLQRQ